MFSVGELIIYSRQGICCIDDICKKTYDGVTKVYYVLHPIENCKLTISIPVDNYKVTMLDIIDKNEAKQIIESFRFQGVSWIEICSQRNSIYLEVLKKGNRKEISKMVNTLMRKKYRADINGKKLYKQDHELLDFAQNILFKELAISLDTTFEAIYEKITNIIVESEK